MILVSKADKPFVYSAKGTPRRKAVIADYESEIQELYQTVEDAAIGGFRSPVTWSLDESTTYARTVVHGVMMRTLGDDDDFFAQGCDRFAEPRSSILPTPLTRLHSAFRQPGSGRSLSMACGHVRGSTPGPFQSSLSTRIPRFALSESSLPT
jgi:hypothetical protein